MIAADPQKEAADLRRHAERMAKALRLLVRAIPAHGWADALEFAKETLVAWERRR